MVKITAGHHKQFFSTFTTIRRCYSFFHPSVRANYFERITWVSKFVRFGCRKPRGEYWNLDVRDGETTNRLCGRYHCQWTGMKRTCCRIYWWLVTVIFDRPWAIDCSGCRLLSLETLESSFDSCQPVSKLQFIICSFEEKMWKVCRAIDTYETKRRMLPISSNAQLISNNKSAIPY